MHRRGDKSERSLYLLFCFMVVVVIAEAILSRCLHLEAITAAENVSYRRVLLAIYLSGAVLLLLRSGWWTAWRLSTISVSPALLLASVTIVISLAVNAQFPTTLVIAAPFLAKFVFYELPWRSLSFGTKIVAVPFLLFAAVPTLVFLGFPAARAYMVFHDGTFTGFAGSRSDFGYLAGLAVLIALAEKRRSAKLCLPFLIYGIWLTESRATMVGLLISVAALTWYRRPAYVLAGVVVAAFLVPPFVLLGHLTTKNIEENIHSVQTTRATFFQDEGGRAILYERAIEQAVRDGPWFGSGRLYTPVLWEGSVGEAHNAFIQSVLNFGIIFTLIWYWLLLRFLAELSGAGKPFVVFLITFGMLQPGFEAWFFAPVVFFTFLLSALYSYHDRSPALA